MIKGLKIYVYILSMQDLIINLFLKRSVPAICIYLMTGGLLSVTPIRSVNRMEPVKSNHHEGRGAPSNYTIL